MIVNNEFMILFQCFGYDDVIPYLLIFKAELKISIMSDCQPSI